MLTRRVLCYRKRARSLFRSAFHCKTVENVAMVVKREGSDEERERPVLSDTVLAPDL
jgi:hypothetical protein